MGLNGIPEWVKSAKLGQKVVCIVTPPLSDRGVQSPVRKGDVREILEFDDCGFPHKMFIRTPDIAPRGDSCWFNTVYFRPVQPKSTETGMKMIRKLLDSVPVKEDA